jgi:hypothetical protein
VSPARFPQREKSAIHLLRIVGLKYLHAYIKHYESSYPLTASLGRFGTMTVSFDTFVCGKDGEKSLQGKVVGILSAGLHPKDFLIGGTVKTIVGPA